jgi:hypothetical protein
MQAYVVLMVLLVIGGTLLDVVHKKSAKYFFEKPAPCYLDGSRTCLIKIRFNGRDRGNVYAEYEVREKL